MPETYDQVSLEKSNKIINKINVIFDFILILLDFSAVRPIKNPETNYDTVSFFCMIGGYSSRMVMPKPPARAVRSFMAVLAVTFLRVMV